MTDKRALHWLVVGYISPSAREWIEKHSGIVAEIHNEKTPPLFAVAIAYDPAGYWSWSQGRQELRGGLEFYGDSEIDVYIDQEQMHLDYGSTEPNIAPAYCSTESTYLLLEDEDFDLETRQAVKRIVKEEQWVSPDSGNHSPVASSSGDNWDPFLDDDDQLP